MLLCQHPLATDERRLVVACILTCADEDLFNSVSRKLLITAVKSFRRAIAYCLIPALDSRLQKEQAA